jgi:hypothetical protein
LVVPTDGMIIRADTTLALGACHLPKGLIIATDGVTLDGGGALLIGEQRTGAGQLENAIPFRAQRRDLEL